MVNDILPDDKANETFDEIDGNITGVEWEAETETQEPETHTPQTYNNQYAALADEEENEDNDNASTGVDNNGEITGVRHDDEITGVDSNNKSEESGSTGKMTNRTNWHSLRRPSQKQNDILWKQLIY